MRQYRDWFAVTPRPVLPCLYLSCNAPNEPSVTVPGVRYVVLLRVSTQKQGADGLGIAAQKRDIDLFLQQQPHVTVIKELVEVESGGKELCDRPVLQEAIETCRRTNSTLLVAKLSRLSRDAAFVLTLMKDSTIRFKVAAMPDADNFQLGIYALLNQQEREQVSTRTRAALAAAKARGVRLGNPKNLEEWNRRRKDQAREFADKHSNLICSLRNKGRTLREICDVLNDAGIKTPRGGLFYPIQVSRILRRAANLPGLD
jgi:DNA invertase Pin-like site-specific DNA recombinase